MNIDVYHDTVCPWCRIGKAHLDRAIAQWGGEPVTVDWHPFFLQPEMPEAGRDFAAHMAALKGDGNLKPLFQSVVDAGAACGVAFDFERVGRAPNTLLSHCLIAAAPDERHEAVLDALHTAYFEQSGDIGDIEVLLAIAEAQGMDREATRAALADGSPLRRDVAGQAEWARSQGMGGVPFFVIDDALAVSGAQPTSSLLAAMQEAVARRAAA